MSAREARLTGVSGREMPSVTSRLSQSKEVFTFDPSTDTELSRTPLLRDPYEERVLAVRESSVPGAVRGCSVFTRWSVRVSPTEVGQVGQV